MAVSYTIVAIVSNNRGHPKNVSLQSRPASLILGLCSEKIRVEGCRDGCDKTIETRYSHGRDLFCEAAPANAYNILWVILSIQGGYHKTGHGAAHTHAHTHRHTCTYLERTRPVGGELYTTVGQFNAIPTTVYTTQKSRELL